MADGSRIRFLEIFSVQSQPNGLRLNAKTIRFKIRLMIFMARTIQLMLSSNFGFNPNTRTWLCIENHCRIASFQSGKIREILAVI